MTIKELYEDVFATNQFNYYITVRKRNTPHMGKEIQSDQDHNLKWEMKNVLKKE